VSDATKKFSGQYVVDDGYVGGDRPQYFSVDAYELDDDMTDEELANFYEETAEECFRQKISISIRKRDAFVEWARAVLAARDKEQ
jgi:hypothetical protein